MAEYGWDEEASVMIAFDGDLGSAVETVVWSYIEFPDGGIHTFKIKVMDGQIRP